jgi:tetratricopeptide (TPR) repeat protein
MFKDVVLKLPRDDQAKAQMLEACRQYYRGNLKILALIDEFEQTYHSDLCISWYTGETFLYKLINQALRTEDIEQLYTFRYYIADLSTQLALEYQKMPKEVGEKIRLYRGVHISKDELERLKTNEGNLVATNGFLSTSRSREYALTFANKLMKSVNTVKVLYEIESDLGELDNSVVFADISQASKIQDELEVLFDLGSTFKIDGVIEMEEENSSLWIVRMTTTREGREIANKFIEENQKEMECESVTIMFSTLLRRIGESNKSLRYLQQLLKAPGNENVAHIHNRIGVAFKDKGEYHKAIWHFNKAYELTVNSNQSDQIYSITVLHNMGLVYAKKHQYSKALEILKDALAKLIEKRGATHCDVATFQSRIGRVYLHTNLPDRALQCQKDALSIRTNCLSANHPTLAFSLADIAEVYYKQGELRPALEYHLQALELRKQVLPPDHHSTAWSIYKIGQLYFEKHDWDLALDYYQQSLKIFEKLESCWNFKVRQVLNHTAMVFDAKKELKNALECRLKLLENQKKIPPVNNRALVQNLNDIIFTLEQLGELKLALDYRLEVFNLRKKLPYVDHWSLTRNLNDIAYDCEQIKEFKLALKCYYEVMESCRYQLSFHDPFRQSIAASITRVKRKLLNYSG